MKSEIYISIHQGVSRFGAIGAITVLQRYSSEIEQH